MAGIEIQLVEDYYMRGDANSWTLSQKRANKKGKLVWYDLGHYTDVLSLLRDILQRSVRLSEAKTLDEMIKYTIKVRRKLKKVLKVFKEFDEELYESHLKRHIKKEFEKYLEKRKKEALK